MATWTVALGLSAAMRQPLNAQPCQPNSEPAIKVAGTPFALGFTASTLGLGVDAGLRLSHRFNLRVSFNRFNYSRTLSSNGINYASAFRLRSLETLVDWFPSRRSFHLSGGLLVYNGNHMAANAVVPNNQLLDAGDENVISNPMDPIQGKASSVVRVVAPVVAIGFGNFVPRAGHVGYSIDLGVVFQGAPHSTLALTGSACDPSGEFCANVAGDPSVQGEAAAARQTINNELFFMKYYPFVSFGVSYRF